jgi:hypothetical protein
VATSGACWRQFLSSTKFLVYGVYVPLPYIASR